MKKISLALCAVAAAIAAPAAYAQAAGDIVMRVRAVYLDSANKNDAQLKSTLNAVLTVPAEAEINNKWLPEVDFTYYFTPNFAAELILTYPQKQTLTVKTSTGGSVDLGTFKHLPPTLTAQYHFTGLGPIKPYVGAGLNYTNISDTKWTATGESLGLNLKRNSYGLAAQIGCDYAIDKTWSVNLDVKKVQIKTDVYSGGNKIGTFKVDPTLIGVGVGYKF
jgi:outer membrane protein